MSRGNGSCVAHIKSFILLEKGKMGTRTRYVKNQKLTSIVSCNQ